MSNVARSNPRARVRLALMFTGSSSDELSDERRKKYGETRHVASTHVRGVGHDSLRDVQPLENIPVSPWPELPDGCPPSEAIPMESTFHRFVNGTAADWQTYAMVHGDAACPAGVSLCSWNALSVFGAVRDAVAMSKTVKKFRRYRLVRFDVDESMGALHRDKPLPNTHHNWWPSASFVAPPDVTDEVTFNE